MRLSPIGLAGIGFSGRTQVTELDRDEDGGTEHGDRADGEGDVHAPGEGIAGYPDQDLPDWPGECPAAATAPPRVSRAAAAVPGGIPAGTAPDSWPKRTALRCPGPGPRAATAGHAPRRRAELPARTGLCRGWLRPDRAPRRQARRRRSPYPQRTAHEPADRLGTRCGPHNLM